ncbi:hypothetical protein IFM12276_31660 [Nocardia sputorum]|uniref:Uncharacterized protein n=1 Tax=Nocardia sputorum TaxID=2984338 RepID=A0ABN6U4J1_9NOCA|nr:hypothetical protein IFM12276_31660 [Nocardia sputorum]
MILALIADAGYVCGGALASGSAPESAWRSAVVARGDRMLFIGENKQHPVDLKLRFWIPTDRRLPRTRRQDVRIARLE